MFPAGTPQVQPPMLDGIDLDPHTVLGLPPGASAETIREAFRQKSLKHHPDRGGDEWAFRIVVRAYQVLTEPRASAGPVPPAGSRQPRPDGPPADLDRGDAARMAPPPGARWSPVRPGTVDRGLDRSRLVQVEVVWIQSEVDDVFAILQGRAADRQLGGWMTLSWPDPELPGDPRALPYADRILLALNATFDELRGRPGVRSARSHIEAGRFEAWLQYPTGPQARDAFKLLHHGLRARGLGVNQWTRILTVPRDAVI